MQKEWEVQCHDLEEGLMREGRGVLREVEEGMRRTVRDAARVVEENEEAVRTRKEALEAVDRAREELQKLE